MYMKNAEAAIQAAIVAHHPKPVTPPPGGVVRTSERWNRGAELIRYKAGEMYRDFVFADGVIPFSKPAVSVASGGMVVLTYHTSSEGHCGGVAVAALEAVVVHTGIKVIPVWTSGAPVWAGQPAWGVTGSAWDSGEPANLESLWGLEEEVLETRAELIRQLS